MSEERSESNSETGSINASKNPSSSRIPRSTDNKKSNKRIFAILSIVTLLILGTLFTSILPVQSLLLKDANQKEPTLEISGYAWNLLKKPVIKVLIIPNPNLAGWRDAYSQDVIQAFRDWEICIQIFVSKHNYSYLRDIRFAVYLAGVDGSVGGDYDITVKWVERLDSEGAAGGSIVLSNADKEIVKASITLPINVVRDGAVYSLSGDDLQNIVADEIGHSLGLGHSDFKGDVLYGFYDFPREVSCHSSLDVYGLAMVYKYIPTGKFEPPAKSALGLQETGILYHYIRE